MFCDISYFARMSSYLYQIIRFQFTSGLKLNCHARKANGKVLFPVNGLKLAMETKFLVREVVLPSWKALMMCIRQLG